MSGTRRPLSFFGTSSSVRMLAVTSSPSVPSPRAALVAQRNRQTVDLGLGRERDRLLGGEPQETADALDKVAYVFFAEGIVEREHRHAVPHFGKTARRRRADARFC